MVLKAVTARSVIWICQDEAKRLYYHANKGGEGAEWVEGKTALFLTDVQRQSGDTFRAVADSDNTVFLVSPELLVIRKANGDEERQEVIGN